MNGRGGISQMSYRNVTKPLFDYRDYPPAPRVVYARNEREANAFVLALKRGPVGLDMEWRVNLETNQSFKTALIQISDLRMIVLIQVSGMKNFPQKVKDIIESRDVVKMGVNIRGDGEKLLRDFGIRANNLVELGGLAQQADPRFSSIYNRSMVSLAKMADMYLNKTLDKGLIRVSDWEANPLSEKQKTYAANDAYSSLLIYTELVNMARTDNIQLRPERYTSNLARNEGNVYIMRLNPASNRNRGGSTKPRFMVNNKIVTKWRWSTTQPGDKVTPQLRKAYTLWHENQASLGQMRTALRSPQNPLAESTVISYVVRAIQANPSLPFDMDRLTDLIHSHDRSWQRYQWWLEEMKQLLA
ncbi:hypothetical protein QCA50_013440 [Cerrena zonata]|uniref:3'-5' exonuclease domain-containing protein n=1 Tax=Cerrena zonata TaxID=2478898 RepID=A0AAW0FU09_9APHY